MNEWNEGNKKLLHENQDPWKHTPVFIRLSVARIESEISYIHLLPVISR